MPEPRAQNRFLQSLSANRLGLLTAVFILTVLAIYVFFVSAGTWTTWPETSRYYDDLATAFRAGHLYLDIQPPAALLALPDPYKPSARNSVPGLKAALEPVTDLTFYGGKFYVYWGPAPAFLLSIVKLLYPGPIPDQDLVFGFLVGLLVFTVLLIFELRRRYFQTVPISLVLIGMIVAALGVPFPWMLANGGIYEATIAAGQFFLVGGLYFAFRGIQQQPASRGKLLLATTFWALAGASRTLILLPAGFLTLMLVAWEATNAGELKPAWKQLPRALILALPLGLTVLALGWYNWARFGSVIETGLRYTLTFRNLNRFYSQSFSPFYFLPSLWIFLFHPFQTLSGFPFISATYGASPAFLYLGNASLYHAEAITGVLFSVPFILFSLIAIAITARSILSRRFQTSFPTNDGRRQMLWLSLSLAGSAFLPFAAVLLYFNVAMRFIAEFLPSLMFLSLLGLWQGYLLLQGKSIGRPAYALAAITLGVASVAISLLLTLAEFYDRLQSYSPDLMHQLARFFGR